jgi:hypothetical protein
LGRRRIKLKKHFKDRFAMTTTSTTSLATGSVGNLLSELLGDDVFRPAEPRSLEETGLSNTLIEGLIVKFLLAVGSSSGRENLPCRCCRPGARGR